jgi:16S rRNA (guanine(966)-N(2))-methyltransferase RsmD
MKTTSVFYTREGLRIISGKYGGRILNPPKNFRARPTTDLAREGLFNILSNKLEFEDLLVLDLFAGTGSVGLEFLSRGVNYVDFIEKNFVHYSFIRQAISLLNISNAKVIRADFFRIIHRLTKDYHLIFADPPYDLPGIEKIPGLILEAGILKPESWIILEHPGDLSFTHHPFFNEHRKYGSVNFTFFHINK